MAKKIAAGAILLIIFASVAAFILINRSSGLRSFVRNSGFNITNGTSEANPDTYEVDLDQAKAVLSALGYKEKNVEIKRLSTPPSDNGLLLPDSKGNTSFSSHLASDGRDMLTWSIYISPDFINERPASMSDEEAKAAKEQGMSHISIRSFIMFSQNPQRNVDTLYPAEKTPILFKLK